MPEALDFRIWFKSLETIGMQRFEIPEEFPRKLCKKLMRQSHPSQCSDEECIAQLNDKFVSIGSACKYIKDHLGTAKDTDIIAVYISALNGVLRKHSLGSDHRVTKENLEGYEKFLCVNYKVCGDLYVPSDVDEF